MGLRDGWNYHALGQEELDKTAAAGGTGMVFEMSFLSDAAAEAEQLTDPIPGVPSVVWGWGKPPEQFARDADADVSASQAAESSTTDPPAAMEAAEEDW